MSKIDYEKVEKKQKYDFYSNKWIKKTRILSETLSDHRQCPKCKNQLIERINSKNQYKFLGCNNYPKCKFTRRL